MWNAPIPYVSLMHFSMALMEGGEVGFPLCHLQPFPESAAVMETLRGAARCFMRCSAPPDPLKEFRHLFFGQLYGSGQLLLALLHL